MPKKVVLPKRVYVSFDDEGFPIGVTKLKSEGDEWKKTAEENESGDIIQAYEIVRPRRRPV